VTKDEGDRYRLYVDGQMILNETTAVASTNFTGLLTIGSFMWTGGHSPFMGWMEDVRISKGICRWTGDFIPPGGHAATATPQFTATPAPLPTVTWEALMLVTLGLTGLLAYWSLE